jgi:4-amino-4-deoxy-L-arabinose transferase-like glycosyltransferase
MPGDNDRIERPARRFLAAAVLAMAAVNASWLLAERGLGEHEAFVSVTAREMIESGDWVWPTCNGEPRLEKTPLSYWLAAACSKITGRVDELAARGPSAVTAVLTAAAILYFVGRILTFRIAAVSAAVWATSLAYIRYSHNARPEMALAFFVATSLLSFYCGLTAKSRSRQIAYMVTAWTAFGLGMLAKGPAPLPLVLLPVFLYVAVFRHWDKVPRLLPLAGTAIFAAIVVPWPLAIAWRLDFDLVLWKQEFVDRFMGDYKPGGKPGYYYLYVMFQYLAPWAAFLAMAAVAPFYRIWNRKQPFMQFAWLWFAADLVFITVSGGKRQHYILPLMPAAAVLSGIILEDMIFTRKAYTRNFARNVLLGHLAALAAAVFAAMVYATGNKLRLIGPPTAAAVITVLAAAALLLKKKNAFACAAMFGGCSIMLLAAMHTYNEYKDKSQLVRRFGAEAAESVGPEDELICYRKVPVRFVQYFGRPVAECGDISQLHSRYLQGQWIVAIGENLEAIRADGRFREAAAWKNAIESHGEAVAAALFCRENPESGIQNSE